MNLNTNPVPRAAHGNLFPNISNMNSVEMMNSSLITKPVFVPFETVPFGAFSSPFPVIPPLLHSSFINPFSGLMNSLLPTSVSSMNTQSLEEIIAEEMTTQENNVSTVVEPMNFEENNVQVNSTSTTAVSSMNNQSTEEMISEQNNVSTVIQSTVITAETMFEQENDVSEEMNTQQNNVSTVVEDTVITPEVVFEQENNVQITSQSSTVYSSFDPFDYLMKPEVRAVQAEFMYHRCRKSCRNDSGRGGSCVCSKGFPKPFREETSDGNDSYPEYRRREPMVDDTSDNRWNDEAGTDVEKQEKFQKNTFIKKKGKHKKEVLDNSRVVPHNLFLLMKYRCHMNVEVCNSITAVKYLYKYVYKGHDKVMYGLKKNDKVDMQTDSNQGPGRNEINEFVEARYCSTSEACWRTFEFSMGKLYPQVQRLTVHLPQEQHVLYNSNDPENTKEVLEMSEMTKLNAFFMVCQEEKLLSSKNGIDWSHPIEYKFGGPFARDLLYRDVGKWYTWVPRNKKKK